MGRFFGLVLAPLFLSGVVIAHGGAAHQKPLQVNEGADWMTRHMAEEHHISDFDASSFFAIHDYDNTGFWDRKDIHKTYGLADVSAKGITQEKQDEVVNKVLDLIDMDKDGLVSREEFVDFIAAGKTLPDFDLGPGHHGDIEFEYEIHHWEKYHDENTKEEDLIHPEDIEHFKHHDDLEDEADRIAQLDKMSVVLGNIPQKFRPK